jgi:hypothetical protein
LLTESLMLSLAGAAVGLFLAQFGADYFNKIPLGGELPVSLVVQLDRRVLIFSLIAAVLSAIFFGLAPAIRSVNTDLVPALKTGETAGWRRRTWGMNALVIAQVALSLVLLSAATQFVGTLRAAVSSNPGFRTDHLMMMSFDPSLVHYSPEKTRDFYRALTERARQLPGAENAALTLAAPFDGSTIATNNILPEGFQFPRGQESESVLLNIVGEHYQRIHGRTLLAASGSNWKTLSHRGQRSHLDASGRRRQELDVRGLRGAAHVVFLFAGRATAADAHDIAGGIHGRCILASRAVAESGAGHGCSSAHL